MIEQIFRLNLQQNPGNWNSVGKRETVRVSGVVDELQVTCQ